MIELALFIVAIAAIVIIYQKRAAYRYQRMTEFLRYVGRSTRQ